MSELGRLTTLGEIDVEIVLIAEFLSEISFLTFHFYRALVVQIIIIILINCGNFKFKRAQVESHRDKCG